MNQRKFKLGLIVNPYAGIGGALALKGSDGKDIRSQALASGAQQLAPVKAHLALQQLDGLQDQLEIYTAQGEMGQDIAVALGFTVQQSIAVAAQTEGEDTETIAQHLLNSGVDMLLFAGGDGTARNVCKVVQQTCPVVGVPAGCKIHSGVYAITPQAAGKVVAQVVKKQLVSLMEAEVKDIDESAFRDGQVIAKHYGFMQVPAELTYMQAVKMGGKESDELVLADIAAHVEEVMQEFDDHLFVMGSGSTVDSMMQEFALPNTLLGVDVVFKGQVIASDVTAAQLLSICEDKPCKLVITLIGGQGHILGRGNQQISPDFIRRIGKQNIIVVASKSKIQNLQNKPLISDSGDLELDQQLSGPIAIVTGYRDIVLYSLGHHD